MDTLYHYCTIESFFAILASRIIRLGDASKMNDSHECVWVDKLIAKLFKDNKDAMSDEDRRDFSIGFQINRPRPFLFCLSQAPDILSQWRAYAGDGTGVSVGFNTDLFPRQSHLPSTNCAPSMNIALWQVVYDGGAQSEMMGRIFSNALGNPQQFSGEHGKPNYQVLGAFMAGLSPLFKNPAFREEQEWRLIHTPQLLTDKNNDHHLVGTQYKIGQRVSNDQIITHFEFLMGEDPRPLVREVWLGPRSKVSESDVKLFFGLNGLGDVKVFQSSATYR